MAYCDLDKTTVAGTCIDIGNNRYIDWNLSYDRGSMQFQRCSEEPLTDLQKLIHTYTCGIDATTVDQIPLKVVVEAHHTELGGMFITKCDTETDLAYVDGVCVACNEVCTDCVLEERQPVCKSCADRAVLLDGECMCEIGRFFDPLTGACERCSEGCNTCISAQECIYCQVPLFVSDG